MEGKGVVHVIYPYENCHSTLLISIIIFFRNEANYYKVETHSKTQICVLYALPFHVYLNVKCVTIQSYMRYKTYLRLQSQRLSEFFLFLNYFEI